jgi:two-component system cell cycle response regulator DivK
MMAKILIIEDNEQNLYLETFILQKNGHDIMQARNGEAAIALANQMHPDLILLDIQLPGMDGYRVAQQLRKNPSIATIPIIAVTSYAMAGDRERILEAGCTSYIEKPINPDTFHVEITQFL